MSDNDDCRAYVPQARLRADSLYRPPSGSPKMSHIDVAKRVLRRVRSVADAHQGRPHRVAALPAWRIARDCGGFDLSGPCEIENATARRHPSRRLAGTASLGTRPPMDWVSISCTRPSSGGRIYSRRPAGGLSGEVAAALGLHSR